MFTVDVKQQCNNNICLEIFVVSFYSFIFLSEKPTEKGFSTATIAGIVVGAIVGGLVALSGIMKLVLNSKRKSISSEPEVA